MSDEAAIRCASCRDLMRRVSEQANPDRSAHLEFYACQGCGRKLALWWELTGAEPSAEQRSWVEREVAAKGSFFPSDYAPRRFSR